MSPKLLTSRRGFLYSLAAVPTVPVFAASRKIPVGIELYSVRKELQKDLTGTLRGVANLGYQCVEFFGPYAQWTLDFARKVRDQLDSLGLHCYSTHNSLDGMKPAAIEKTIDLNNALGSHWLINSSPGNPHSLDDWKRIAEDLNSADERAHKAGLGVGYHNHESEWRQVEAYRPMDVLAESLRHTIILQLDVGTCLAAGAEPVQWIKQNPGRIRSLHLKDWSPQGGYRALFGEGIAPWKEIFAAAEQVGGAEYYLIEQEGSQYSEMETAKRCLATYNNIHH